MYKVLRSLNHNNVHYGPDVANSTIELSEAQAEPLMGVHGVVELLKENHFLTDEMKAMLSGNGGDNVEFCPGPVVQKEDGEWTCESCGYHITPESVEEAKKQPRDKMSATQAHMHAKFVPFVKPNEEESEVDSEEEPHSSHRKSKSRR